MRAGGYAVGTLLALASTPLMIRHLGFEDFGRYVTVMSLVTIVAGFTEAGLNTIALREYAARAGAERHAVMRDLLGHPPRADAGRHRGRRVVRARRGLRLGPRRGHRRRRLRAAPAIAAAAARSVAAGRAALRLDHGDRAASPGCSSSRSSWPSSSPRPSSASFFLAQIPAFAADAGHHGLARAPDSCRCGRRSTARRWWPLLRATFAYAIAVALNATYFRIAIVALSLLATERETGYFATAFRVIEVLIAVPALIVGAAFPILARAARDDRDRLDYAAGRLVEVSARARHVARARPVPGGRADHPAARRRRLRAERRAAAHPERRARRDVPHRHRRATCCSPCIAIARSCSPTSPGSTASVGLTAVLVPAYDATGAAVALLAAEVVAGGRGARGGRPAAACRRAIVARARRSLVAVGVAAGLVGIVPGVPAVVAAVARAAGLPAAARRRAPLPARGRRRACAGTRLLRR